MTKKESLKTKVERLEIKQGSQQIAVSQKMQQHSRSLLNVIWESTCQQEREHRQALAFYIGYRVYGNTLRDWPKKINPDVWLAAQKAFMKFFYRPEHIKRESLEILLQCVTNSTNFDGAHTPQQCWEEFFAPCPYPRPTPDTSEPEPAPMIRPTRVNLPPETVAPGM